MKNHSASFCNWKEQLTIKVYKGIVKVNGILVDEYTPDGTEEQVQRIIDKFIWEYSTDAASWFKTIYK